jgi:hypothetical protein
MQRFGDRFDHNLHALRIVERFEQRYARFPGLNLTFEVREGIAKHSRDYEPGEMPATDEYLPGLRPPLEAQIIDLADEIAYNTADLDDAYSARMFAIEDVAAAAPLYAEIFETVEMQYPGATEREQFQECLRQLIDALVRVRQNERVSWGLRAPKTSAGIPKGWLPSRRNPRKRTVRSSDSFISECMPLPRWRTTGRARAHCSPNCSTISSRIPTAFPALTTKRPLLSRCTAQFVITRLE